MHEGTKKTLRISPSHTVEDWENLKPLDSEAKWAAAIGIFRDRMEGRYLSVLDRVQKIRNGGFVLVAMDCALVETLQQFREGVPDANGSSRALFVKCLKEPPFGIRDDVARTFYKAFRCGLLHKAQTDLGSRLSREGAFARYEGAQLVVNRDLFHSLVREAYADYYVELADPTKTVLREKFVKKMDYVATMRGSATLAAGG